MELGPYQKDLAKRFFASLSQKENRILIQLWSGAGKTILFSHIIQTLVNQGLKGLTLKEISKLRSTLIAVIL